MRSKPKLNRRLTLEDPLRVSDGLGGFSTTWQPQGDLWAEVALRSGRETAGLSQTQLTIRLRAAPQGSSLRPRADQRFREGERIYHIDAVHESDASRRYLTCRAHEEVAT